MLADIKRVLRLSSVYGGGDFLAKGMGLLLLPLYTAYLRPKDYGILAIVSAAVSIVSILLTFGLRGAAVKFYYDLDGKERKDFYGTLWLFLILVPGIILVTVELFGGRPLNAFLGQVPYAPYGRLALWIAYISIALIALPRELFLASERAIAYTGLNIGQFVLATGFTIWLVVGLRQGAEGALWARLIGAVGVGSVSAVYFRRASRFNLDVRLLKRALLYSLPLVPHFLSQWVLSASDRIILGRHVPLADIGVYQVGYQIGSVMLLLAIAGNNAIMPMYGRLDVTNHRNVEKLMRMVTYYVLGLTAAGTGIVMFSREAIYLLTPADYHGANIVAPLVVLGCFFMGLYFIPVSVLILIAGNTRPVPVCTLIAALTNLGLNLWLIPKYGIVAAAATTAFSYFVMFLGISFSAQANKPMPYEYRRIGITLGAGFAVSILAVVVIPAPHTLYLSLLLKTGLLASFFLLLYITKFFNAQEERFLLSMITTRRS